MRYAYICVSSLKGIAKNTQQIRQYVIEDTYLSSVMSDKMHLIKLKFLTKYIQPSSLLRNIKYTTSLNFTIAKQIVFV